MGIVMFNKPNFDFEYMKTPLNKYTFKNKRIREWVERKCEGLTLNLFAGLVKLDINEIRNDENKKVPADYHYEALKFIEFYYFNHHKYYCQNEFPLFATILLDPPYSYRKSMEMYEGIKCSPFNRLKNDILKILSPEGYVITFGYHSVSMGEKRGFIQDSLLVMSHGGAIHDTIAVKERRIKVVC